MKNDRSTPLIATLAVMGITFAFAVLVTIYALALMAFPNSKSGEPEHGTASSTSEKTVEIRRELGSVQRMDDKGNISR